MLGAGHALWAEVGAGISHATFREFTEFFKHGLALWTDCFDGRVCCLRLLYMFASAGLPVFVCIL